MKRHEAALAALAMAGALVILAGCGSRAAKQQKQEFFTSGSGQADQRATQRMAQAEQLSGSGEGAGQKNVQPATTNATNTATSNGTATNVRPAVAKGELDLYDRLGGEAGISNIVADFLPRAMDDPRVNWDRLGVTRGGLSFHRGESESWDANPTNVARLKLHLVQFLCLATGGPTEYQGKEIKAAHARMHISNAEFDATVGDLKATLDKLQVPNLEQKQLLAIVESTRTEIVTER